MIVLNFISMIVFPFHKKILKILYHLQYSKEIVKQIVQSLEYGKKQIILTGPPGTGKTYILDKLNDLFQQSEENKEFVQFHQVMVMKILLKV